MILYRLGIIILVPVSRLRLRCGLLAHGSLKLGVGSCGSCDRYIKRWFLILDLHGWFLRYKALAWDKVKLALRDSMRI